MKTARTLVSIALAVALIALALPAEAGEKQIVWSCEYRLAGTARTLSGVPDDCTEALIWVRDGDLSFYLSGVTTPTANDGMVLTEDNGMELYKPDIGNFEGINVPTGGVTLYGIGYAVR